MEPHVSLDERLNQILTSFAKWHGDSEEAGRLMAANAVVIAAMQAEEQSHSPQNQCIGATSDPSVSSVLRPGQSPAARDQTRIRTFEPQK